MKRKLLHFWFFTLSCCLALPVTAATAFSIGNLQSFKQEGNKISIQADNATMEITAYRNDIIRVRAFKHTPLRSFSYAIDQEATGSFTNVSDEASKLSLQASGIKVEITKSPLRINFYSPDGKLLNADDPRFGISWLGTDVTCYKKLFNDEKFIGLGEKTGPLNKRSMSYENWNSDVPAYALDKDPLYATIPFYIGLHDGLAYGIFFDNTHRSTFSFGASTDGEMTHFGAVDGEMDYYFFAGNSVRNIIEGYTWLTGRPKLPPLWSLGYQQCRYSYYPDKEVLNVAQTFRDKKFPCDVIYLDIHYMDNYKVFTWNPERFPEPKKMIDELKNNGFHLAVIIDPGLKIENGYKSYEEGLQHNYFLSYPNGQPYIGSVWPGRSCFPDFTRSEVRQWWGEQFSSLTGKGVEGFWNDMNEPAMFYSDESLAETFRQIKSFEGKNLDIDSFFAFSGLAGSTFNRQDDYERFYNRAQLKDGSTDVQRHDAVHNLYGAHMTRAAGDGLRKLSPDKRVLLYSRASCIGAHRYGGIWTGDNNSWWSHLKQEIQMMSGLNMCGFLYSGADIGGFGEDTSRDLVLRWTEFGIFTPLMRNHSAWNTRRQECYQFEHIEDFRSVLRLRYALLPFMYSEFIKAALSGSMYFRPLAFDYPDDERAARVEDELLLGESLLVAPVYEQNAEGRYVYLPCDMTQITWQDGRARQEHAAKGDHYVHVPLNAVVFFIKKGHTVPLCRPALSTQELDTSEFTFIGDGSSYSLYEDDGYTRNVTLEGNIRILTRE